MQDKRYDNRPRLNYNFTQGKCVNEVAPPTAGFKSKRPSRGSSEPRGNATSNSSFRVTGRAGRVFKERTKEAAESLLAAALSAL